MFSKKGILVANVFLIIAVMTFVILYSVQEDRSYYNRQLEAFEKTSFALERVTEVYLEGEQQICDVWARYINTRDFTMDEAMEFILASHVMPTASAHIIYTDSLTGFSTRSSDSSGFEVDYQAIDIFRDLSWISDVGESINVTRTYPNPANGEPSLAFCNRIFLRTSENVRQEALLLRVIPVVRLEEKWVFPKENYQNAEFSIIDGEGSYIIKGRSFTEGTFFDDWSAANGALPDQAKWFQDITSRIGTFTMKDAGGRECLMVHTPIVSSRGWTLLSLNPANEFHASRSNWLLIGVVSVGLLILLVIDIVYMQMLNHRLQAAAQEAEAASRAKTDFLSTMSHDIRTPMNAIIGLTALAEKNKQDPEAVGDHLRKISMASNHLLTLINDILDISKIESGKLTLSPLTFSIVETVENLVNLSQPMIREKNIEFSFHINQMEKEYLYADQLRLNQIYINILTNAIKYTEPGGRISVTMREDKSEKPGCVRLTYIVADTGIGMTPEFMQRMYHAFSRQTDSRVNTIQGTGLGLAITKQMVDLMHGTIDCESEVGKGTTFTVVIDIPIADRQRDDMRLDPVDVLLVDDDEVMLCTAEDTLRSLGARVECASSGEEALGMLSRRLQEGREYGVIILDWKMPGMDGIETVRRIRAGKGGHVPVLLISAYDWSDVEDAAREAGVSGFISKPLFRSTLYDRISELLGKEVTSVEPEDDYSDLAGMRILVAEDNDINWEIISAMLSMFGIETERAANGRLCLETMQNAAPGSYSLIFMDVQMPEMNGLDATRNIRALPDPWASSIPIIAMTADAFSENVTECLQAGMNGHIAKPVDIKLVIKEVRRIREEEKKQMKPAE